MSPRRFPICLRQSDELGRQTYVYSSTRGSIIRIARPLGQNEYRAYDSLSRLTGVTDARGAVWANVYDMEGNRLSASDPDLGTWTYQYDAANRLVSQTDAGNR